MANQPQQKENPQDILVVKNIDTGCTFISSQVSRRTTRTVDPETGAVSNGYEDVTEEIPHSEYFQVRWAGQRFRIAPGQQRLYPRYIAEHFAKHLVDHILGKQEVEYAAQNPGKVVSLINNSSRRKALWDEILPNVQQYFEELGEIDEGMAALNQVEELNSSAVAAEMGVSDGKTMELADHARTQEAPVKDPMSLGGAEIVPTEDLVRLAVDDPNEPVPAGYSPDEFANLTKADIIGQIRKLDPLAKLTGSESKAVLLSKLKGF